MKLGNLELNTPIFLGPMAGVTDWAFRTTCARLGADVTVSDAMCGDENGEGQEPATGANKPKTVEFKPYQPKYRKRGTGSVHQVSKNVWEGRYTPTVNGKRIARTIYADSEEECEIKLEALIKEMKAEFGIK